MAKETRQMGRVAIAGASGYVGGELLRLLLKHPQIEVVQATSERLAGQFVHAARDMARWTGLAPRIVDCSADFRLRDAAEYRRWYGADHPAPDWLERFVYGLPEASRVALREARYVSGVGCNATAVNLALLPLARAGLIDTERPVIAEVKVGSSEGGDEPTDASHH